MYADYAAEAPVSERVKAALFRALETPGNPSSVHGYGREAAALVERAREQTAALLHADPEEIFFTSGGTEADNWAIRCGCRMAGADSANRTVAVSAVEHPAVRLSAEAAAREGELELTVIPAEPDGRVAPYKIKEAFDLHPPLLAAVMLANNETGAVMPIAELAEKAHTYGAYFHCDAVQAAGQISIDVRELGCDFLAVSGHKLGAPAGVGALWIRGGVRIPPLLFGGGQEKGMRSGSVPAALIAAFGEACAEAAETLDETSRRIRLLRRSVERELLRIPGAVSNTPVEEANRLPGIANLSFEGVGGEALMLMADLHGTAFSTGSACHAGNERPSPVLTAMGIPEERAKSAVRISLGRETTETDCRELCRLIRTCVGLIRGNEAENT